MRYLRFGQTELSMPAISCGGMRYHHKWEDVEWNEIPKEGQKNLERTLAAAIDLGINHIETARGYGSSEMQLGYALKQFQRESFILQTKVGPENDPREFRSKIETSLNYLQVDSVDLLSIHGINNRERIQWSMRKGGCLEEARKVQKAGLAKHVGFSTHATLSEILELINTGEFEYINLHWYFVNQLNGPAIEAAAKQDMGVFIISPNDKGGRLYTPPEKLVEICKPLHPMAFNDLFCWASPHVHTVSCGASCPEDFDLHVEAMEHFENADKLITPIITKIQDEVEKTFGPDWYDNWFKNLPEWTDTPHQINVKDILRLFTWAKSIDLIDFAKWRYSMLDSYGHWIPGKRVQRFKKQDMLDAVSESPFAEQIPAYLKEADALLKGYTGPT